MKKIVSVVAILMFLSSIAVNLSAQNHKFGHVDSQKILSTLPESKEAQKKLEAEGKAMQDQMEIMQVEYNNKVNDYLTNKKLPDGDPKKWSDLILQDKEKEIQSLGQRVQEFQQTAQQKIAEKKNELLKPILDKVDKAIKAVGKENKFLYIFEVQQLLYFSNESIDVTDMVKAKLASM